MTKAIASIITIIGFYYFMSAIYPWFGLNKDQSLVFGCVMITIAFCLVAIELSKIIDSAICFKIDIIKYLFTKNEQ